MMRICSKISTKSVARLKLRSVYGCMTSELYLILDLFDIWVRSIRIAHPMKQ